MNSEGRFWLLAGAALSALLSAFNEAILSFYENNVESKSMTGRLLRRARRFYLPTFKPEYVEQTIKEREGECHRCGACCQLIYKCPFLGRDSTNLPYCRIYGDLRPANCHSYPIDRRDSEVRGCGYKFKPAPELPYGNRPGN